MTALLTERSGITATDDKKAVYEHLAAHYKLFNKTAPEFITKEAQAGDACTADDGTPGTLAADPNDADGAMVCVPQEDKTAKAENGSQKTLLKSVDDEHDRHTAEIDKSFDNFQQSIGSSKPDAGEDDETKAKRLSDDAREMRVNLKDLRSALADEHTMHRAKSVASFRDFTPSDSKAFDKNEHLKALRDQHDEYETKNNKALDTFEEKCMKSVGDSDKIDEHLDSVTGRMETNGNVHKKSVTKIAKSMCKEAFGEEDQADEKTIEILKEFLSPHIDAQLLPAVASKIGAKLASELKSKLGEAHQNLKAATAVLEALHKGFADASEEEGRSDSIVTGAGDGPRDQRSRTRTASHSDPALQAHIQAREIMRGIEAAAREGLGKFNAEIRDRSKK
jgi:hypothetical protein